MASINLPQGQSLLQELLEAPKRISQRDLAELEDLERRARTARIDYEGVVSEIVERLVLGWPVESGRRGAHLQNGRLIIFEQEVVPDEDCPL
jgi:hypothetical protein